MDRALPSVRAQTYRNLEIIVAAHGCTDDTKEKVEAINDSRIRVLDVPRRATYPPTAENHWLAGPVAPANAALEAATGDWIFRLDDDDILDPHCIEALLDWAECGYEFVSAAHETHEGKVEPYVWHGQKIGAIQTTLYRGYLKFFRYDPQCYRRSWWRVNDVNLQYRMLRAGVRMGYMDRVVARVLPRPGETHVGLKAYQDNKVKKERDLLFR